MNANALRSQASGAAIAARLRRLSERIDREANAIYAAQRIAFEQRWYGTLALLDEHGPLSVVEVARTLGITHVAISQTRRSLVEAGLVEASPDPKDGRRRTLRLTATGTALVARLWPLWDAFNLAGEGLNREADNVAACLDRLEAALDRQPLLERVAEAIASLEAGQRQPT